MIGTPFAIVTLETSWKREGEVSMERIGALDIKALSDQGIMVKVATDRDYLAVLVECYGNALYNFVYRFMSRRETAEDIVQEAFLRCLPHRKKCPPTQHVSTWLFTIAANLAKTELRRRKRWTWVPNRTRR